MSEEQKKTEEVVKDVKKDLVKESETEEKVMVTTVDKITSREQASNDDAIEQAKKESENLEEKVKKPNRPKFFLVPNKRVKIEVDILTDAEGNIKSISKTGLGVDFNLFPGMFHFTEWVKFTLPTFEQLTNYRSRSGSFNSSVGQVIIDNLKLRNFYLVFHLKDWSITNEKGERVELKYEPNGEALSDESIEEVYKTIPTLLDIFLNLFEKEILVK